MRRSTNWVLREATIKERLKWNESIIANPHGGNILQTAEFARIKQKDGWSARYLVYETPQRNISALVLYKYIFPLGNIWYFPKGPEIKSVDDLRNLFLATKSFCKINNLNVFLIKVEPELIITPTFAKSIEQTGFRCGTFIQPNTSTITLDVSENPDEQLQYLGRRARRYIRRATRDGVSIYEVEPTIKNFQQMYSFMQTAFGGQGIPNLRSYSYYLTFWQEYISQGLGKLYFGFEGNIPTVGVFVIHLGKKAVYKDGGSTTGRTSQATAYYIHWHIMNELSKIGVALYDLWGTPSSNQLENKKHPLWGIGNFKTAFSKEVTDYVGVLDGVTQRYKYFIWSNFIYPTLRIYYKICGTSFW